MVARPWHRGDAVSYDNIINGLVIVLGFCLAWGLALLALGG